MTDLRSRIETRDVSHHGKGIKLMVDREHVRTVQKVRRALAIGEDVRPTYMIGEPNTSGWRETQIRDGRRVVLGEPLCCGCDQTVDECGCGRMP